MVRGEVEKGGVSIDEALEHLVSMLPPTARIEQTWIRDPELGDQLDLSVSVLPRMITYSDLLRAIAESELNRPRKPLWWEAFFINRVRPAIFLMYDDRGVDVIAEKRETLLPLFETFNDLILEHDRARVDRVFAAG